MQLTPPNDSFFGQKPHGHDPSCTVDCSHISKILASKKSKNLIFGRSPRAQLCVDASSTSLDVQGFSHAHLEVVPLF